MALHQNIQKNIHCCGEKHQMKATAATSTTGSYYHCLCSNNDNSRNNNNNNNSTASTCCWPSLMTSSWVGLPLIDFLEGNNRTHREQLLPLSLQQQWQQQQQQQQQHYFYLLLAIIDDQQLSWFTSHWLFGEE
jgi:hypothetical protein